ncbi:O-antigen ligase family protein [Haploplasma axanthum]|nr:hypothetical protein [Haploplasma axanthum]
MSNFRADKHQLVFQIVFGVLSIYLVFQLLYKCLYKKQKLKGKLLIPLIIFLGYSLITFIWTVNVVSAISRVSIIIQGYVLYLALVNSDDKVEFKEISWFFSLFLLTLSFEYIVILARANVFFNFETKYYLMDLWANPNIVATVFAIGFVPSLYKYFIKDGSKLKYLYLPLEILIVYAIYATQSKGLYFGLFVMILMIPIIILIKNKKLILTSIYTIIFGFAGAMILLVIFKDNFPELFTKIDSFSSSRVRIYEIGINELKNPFTLYFGKGIGSTHHILLDNGFSNFYFHSWFFQTLVNQGLIGITITLTNLYLIFKMCLNTKDKFKYFAYLGLIAYVFHTLIDVGYEYQFLGVMYYMLVAVLEKNLNPLESGEANEKTFISS